MKKESYGDLLEKYTEVKNFCDTIELEDRFLKLGDLEECNLGSVCKSNFQTERCQCPSSDVRWNISNFLLFTYYDRWYDLPSWILWINPCSLIENLGLMCFDGPNQILPIFHQKWTQKAYVVWWTQIKIFPFQNLMCFDEPIRSIIKHEVYKEFQRFPLSKHHSRTSNIESNDSQNGGSEDYNIILMETFHILVLPL